MKRNFVLILGCGDLGARTAAALPVRDWRVAGARRDIARLPVSIAGHAVDYTVPHSLDFTADLRPEYILATFNPAGRCVAGYQAGFATAMANLLAGLGAYRPRQIIAVSSTRVFAERDGGWVDESSPLTGDDPRALAMIEAERMLLDSSHAACVVRFAGIYGAPGGRMLARASRGEVCPPQPLRFGNRIHRDDGAGFLAHLLRLAASGATLAPVYLGVDDRPAPRHEVESWLARKVGATVRTGSAEPLAAAGHKRCRNKALRDSGYRLLYPDYQSGYGAVLRHSRGQDGSG